MTYLASLSLDPRLAAYLEPGTLTGMFVHCQRADPAPGSGHIQVS
jgi:hypothetical protein